MKLVIREYLGMLREAGEFDVLMPQLLFAMGLPPISKPQRGVRQGGVDIAAVGPDEDGDKKVWLFILKRGDIGRVEWSSGKPQDVRTSLEEAKDKYIQANIPPEYKALPVRIVVAITGDFKQEAEQNYALYAQANSSEKISYSFWNVERVASLVEQHLLNEYCFPGDTCSLLRRALALAGEVDYELEHFYQLLDSLLTQVKVDEEGKQGNSAKAMERAITSVALALAILAQWAKDEGHSRNGVLAGERALLWTWDAIVQAGLADNKRVLARYFGVVEVYLTATASYLNKVGAYLSVPDALLPYFRDSALYTERIFDEIGMLATIGWVHTLIGVVRQDEALMSNGKMVAEALEAFLDANPCSGSPCFDGHAIEISLGVMYLLAHGRRDAALKWLGDLTDRTGFAFAIGRWYPIATDSIDDLAGMSAPDEKLSRNLQQMSWMVPTLAQWLAALAADDVYEAHVKNALKNLPETCFQLWYPDNDAKVHMYRRGVREFGVTEAPIPLLTSAEEMREHMQRVRAETEVGNVEPSSAIRRGIPWLDFIANRHFRTPVDPSFWQENSWAPLFSAEASSDESADLAEG